MAPRQVTKVTLSSGKVVLLSEIKISIVEQAAQQVAPRANGDANVLQFLMQKAMLQGVLYKINDKDVTAIEREDMDSLFTMAEYSQLLSVITKMSGGDDLGKQPKLEIVTSGDK